MADGINNVDTTIIKLATEYQATLVKSSELNEQRANIRENVEKLGISAEAFQVGLRMAKGMTKGERSDYSDSLNRVLSVLDGKEADLFGADEIAARDKRAAGREERKHKAGTPRETQDARSDANPKSDPNRGGAGKGKANGKGKAPAVEEGRPALQPDGTPWPDDVQAARNANEALEQEQGAKILEGALPKSTGEAVDKSGENTGDAPAPKSQSQIASEKLAAAGLH